mmetsp:Transcript_33873/g.32964  ORF Transcript_33873/g.32964 Transcript_33873/m.32964 type:complete len:154 (-) Transcript_33873:864-1325(-)
MTRVDSMFIFNPNRDIVEDRKYKTMYGFKEINTVMTRLKLLIYLILYLKGIDRPVLYFDYPRHSYLWCVFLISLTYFFNPNYLLTYLLFLGIIILSSNSTFWQQTVTPHINYFLFRDDLIHPLIKKNHPVRTSAQLSEEKSIVSLKEAGQELK